MVVAAVLKFATLDSNEPQNKKIHRRKREEEDKRKMKNEELPWLAIKLSNRNYDEKANHKEIHFSAFCLHCLFL